MDIVYKKPTLLDIKNMQKLVKPEVDKGIILYRSDDEMAMNIRSYFVAELNKEIVGFCALQIYSIKLGEIRSLIVKDGLRGKNIGKNLITCIEKEGKELGVEELFSLTYERGFFEKLGYQEIDKDKLPEQKIWADCIKCKLFPICKEIAFIKAI